MSDSVPGDGESETECGKSDQERVVMCGHCPNCGSDNVSSVSPPYFALGGGKDDEVAESLLDCLNCDKPFVIMYIEKRSAVINESTKFSAVADT